MPRPIQITPNRSPRRQALAAIGDSLTQNASLNVRPNEFWPERLAVALRELGCPIIGRNFGISGNTTTQMLARIGVMTQFETPNLAIIWGGVNDPGSEIVGATTQDNIEAMGETLLDAGVPYLVIGNTQYLNYSSGGDTLETPSATYATLRTYQLAAANALIAAHPDQVAYCDIYGHMRQLIVDGDYTQGDHLWHVEATNQHLNAIGEQIVADVMLATIQAQDGWVTALGGVTP